VNSFISRPIIIAQTIGERLKKVRLGNSLSLEYVAKKTGIKVLYLESIESGQYNDLPGDIYCLEFIKLYAGFLGMDPLVAAEAYKDEKQKLQNYKLRPVCLKTTFPLRVFCSFFLVLVFVGAITSFAFKFSFSSPSLEIFSPQAYHKIYESKIVLSGIVDLGATLMVNNQKIPIDSEGKFIYVFNAPPGVTFLAISATDSRGRETVEYRTIFFDKDYLNKTKTSLR
jgi:transcriptional regulator with XRE-family HTH domain